MTQSRYEQSLTAMYGLGRFGIKLGLDTIESILSAIGNPHHDFRSIHISGTNGKGSVATMVASILMAAGYRVGKYTSPHLESFNERICINNTPITDDGVVAAHDKVRNVANLEREPTFFEITTAMALYEFSRQKVDWAVIETGMGGRLDATNILRPALCLITNISLEHKDYLGSTIAAIAYEKAGIIKHRVPVIAGATQKSAQTIISGTAKKHSAPLFMKGRDFRCRRTKDNRFHYYGMARTWIGLEVSLSGSHQVDNAALALAACETLENKQQIKVSPDAVRQGLSTANWPGRLEVISQNPCLILDGAHNLMAARVLARHLSTHYADRKITLVVGILDDKPCESILKVMAAPCHRAVITQPKIDRAIPADRLAAIAEKYFPAITIVPDVGQAVKQAVAQSAPEDVICVAGSLYVVGEAKTALRNIELSK